jgi:hypothetical protein
MWWDDDDYWNWDDGEFMNQAAGLDANRHRLSSGQDDTDSVSTFLLVLEGMVYAIGTGFLLVGSYVAFKICNGQAGTVYQALAMELSEDELEMIPNQRMAITPDVLRTT